jgi:hypothetical protein
MPKLSPIYRFISVLIVCIVFILVGTPVQTQERPEDIQNEIQNLKGQIQHNRGIQQDLERQLRETSVAEDREELERRLEKLRIHIEELERNLNDIRNTQKGPMPGPNDGPPPTFIESIINALKSPTVWAAIIGAIGAIIAALIGIKKRK